MKLNGIFGTGSGKVGASVWAVNSGVQIVRPYQPKVSNPNTDAQVEQRAKLKLMSQLAAALAPGLAFKKKGLVSPRNQFIAKNIGICTYSEDIGAQVDVLSLAITPGTQAGPTYTAELVTNSHVVNVTFPQSGNENFDGFIVVSVSSIGTDIESQLRFNDVVYLQKGTNLEGTEVDVKYSGEDAFIFAYGLTGAKSSGSISYENYLVEREQGIASLEVVKRLLSNYENVSANVNKKAVSQ